MKGPCSVLLAAILTASPALAGGAASPLSTVRRGDVCSASGLSYSGPFTLDRMTEMELALAVEAEQIRSEEAGGHDVWPHDGESATCHVFTRVLFDFSERKGGGYDYTMTFEVRRDTKFVEYPGTALWGLRERGHVREDDNFEEVLEASIARLHARFIIAWRQSHP